MPRRDEDPEYKEFLDWKANRKGADDEEDDDLEDDDGQEDDDDEEDGGIAVLTGKRADAFIERMFGGGPSAGSTKTKPKTGKRRPEPEPEDDDEDDVEDPEPADRGHRFFRGRTRG